MRLFSGIVQYANASLVTGTVVSKNKTKQKTSVLPKVKLKMAYFSILFHNEVFPFNKKKKRTPVYKIQKLNIESYLKNIEQSCQ